MTAGERAERHLEGYARILTEACGTGRRLRRDELEDLRAGGERAAEAGVGLRALVRAQLAVAEAVRPTLEPGAVGHLLAAVGQAVDASAEGHERAQRLAIRREETARREFIDDLLHGRSDLGRLAERAERFGLLLSRAHAVAVAESSRPYGDGHPVTRGVEAALTARFGARRILLATKNGRLICIAPGDQEDVLGYFAKRAYDATDGGRVAIGRAHAGVGGVVRSYEEALSALDLAVRMELADPVLRAADLLVYPVLTRDRQAMADLVVSVLGPLRGARGGAEPLLATLTAYFDTGCVTAEAARKLGLSVRAVTYRLARIHQLTGADPGDPMHRYTLQTAVVGARLLDWPAQEL
ncbi:helix-turn-helix domain-containing protein [Streptomyces sp. LP05-1]|uniref:Helix-turn-helix domain-containing protein n=1 Tax=Streptomyces pyxinae TaxID=2970734 RepID=A0ABT2CDE9_9ACTN|nr:helix-turn-helix domain-containing protein [Streptomyces sp. LP05-1]MCS0634786.1 helix-turn-helix domain-containing protein [Streptomyces sp. LP05-1]